MGRFLYGADAKRIQTYIFNASKLQEIAGASELVQHVCTDFFKEFCKKHGIDGVELVIGAAGNIRAVIPSEEGVRELMLRFPFEVMQLAPGLELVQGVVSMSEALPTWEEAQELARRLNEALPVASPYKDWSVTVKAPQSGRPACGVLKSGRDRGILLDPESKAKRSFVQRHWENLFQLFDERGFPADAEVIAAPDNYLAVIHSDGNSIGQTLMRLRANDGEPYGKKWKTFSEDLNAVTCDAAKGAFDAFYRKELRFRPIILGGDDLTVVCSAAHALEFTQEYLKAFEALAKKKDTLGELTACAGVAFVKASYPFHYSVKLAEMLCGQAKKVAKDGLGAGEKVPSCLMFARELGGFVDESYEDFAERELKSGEVSQSFGPYGIQEDGKLPEVSALLDCAKSLSGSAGSALQSGLRRILHELHVSRESADFLADRLEQVSSGRGSLGELKKGLARLGRLGDAGEDRPLRELYVVGKRSPLVDLLLAAKFVD